MRKSDLEVRQQILQRGELEEGYHPDMEAVHRQNAARLRDIVAQFGWPDIDMVGDDGTSAAWLVAQHAIGEPEFQRSALALINDKVAAGKLPPEQAAYLFDRIAMYEGKPQRYGTNSLPSPDGRSRRWTTEDPKNLDARRAAVGLPPVGPDPPETTPTNEQQWKHAEWLRGYERWLVESGWRRPLYTCFGVAVVSARWRRQASTVCSRPPRIVILSRSEGPAFSFALDFFPAPEGDN